MAQSPGSHSFHIHFTFIGRLGVVNYHFLHVINEPWLNEHHSVTLSWCYHWFGSAWIGFNWLIASQWMPGGWYNPAGKRPVYRGRSAHSDHVGTQRIVLHWNGRTRWVNTTPFFSALFDIFFSFSSFGLSSKHSLSKECPQSGFSPYPLPLPPLYPPEPSSGRRPNRALYFGRSLAFSDI